MVGTKPVVSLCMATCLRADLFPEALSGLLRQTYAPLEIVVLADGADPTSVGLLQACRDNRVRWLTTSTASGMVPAWNRVVREARGRYFLFCADDDVLLDGAIDQQVELMEAHAAVAFCHADFSMIDDEGREIERWVSHRGRFIDSGEKSWPDYLVSTRCCMQTTLVRKTLWDQVGGWDEDAGNPGDNSLYLKLLRVGSVGHVPHLACKYRIRTRRPDTWEKRFQNLREYHALAVRHLQSPPNGLSVQSSSIRRRLMSRLAGMGITLATSSPGEVEQRQLREWLQAHVWPGSPLGRFCALIDRGGQLRWLELLLASKRALRRAGKNIILRISRPGE